MLPAARYPLNAPSFTTEGRNEPMPRELALVSSTGARYVPMIAADSFQRIAVSGQPYRLQFKPTSAVVTFSLLGSLGW